MERIGISENQNKLQKSLGNTENRLRNRVYLAQTRSNFRCYNLFEPANHQTVLALGRAD